MKKKQTNYINYFASCDGSVFSYCYGYESRLRNKIKNGYFAVDLTIEKKIKQKYIHRIIAETFIPNPDNKPQVNHINGIKTDNRVENLEWVTGKENMQHAFNILGFKGGRFGVCGKLHHSSKPILMFKNGVIVKEYESISLALKDGFRSSKISLVLSGKRKQYKGYTFMLK